MQSIDKGYLSVVSKSIQHYYQHKPDVICLSIKAYLHLTGQGGSNCPSQTASYHQTYIIDNFIIRENNFHRFVLNIYETKTEDRARRRAGHVLFLLGVKWRSQNYCIQWTSEPVHRLLWALQANWYYFLTLMWVIITTVTIQSWHDQLAGAASVYQSTTSSSSSWRMNAKPGPGLPHVDRVKSAAQQLSHPVSVCSGVEKQLN